jgi:hypothetical protein
MPIRASEKARYPKDWPALSRAARERARWRCEFCGVENGALGGRPPDGRWFDALPTGTQGLDYAWPKPGDVWSCVRHGEVLALRIVRIVLTVAHLDHTPENCAPENLRALCQRCHLRYDAAHHARNAAATRRARRADGDLFA